MKLIKLFISLTFAILASLISSKKVLKNTPQEKSECCLSKATKQKYLSMIKQISSKLPNKVDCLSSATFTPLLSDEEVFISKDCCRKVLKYLDFIEMNFQDDSDAVIDAKENMISKNEDFLKRISSLKKNLLEYKDVTLRESQLYSNILRNSKIIKGKEEAKLLKNWIDVNRDYKFVLCYSSELHDKSVTTFHNRCDQKGAWITLVESEYGERFGGFSNNPLYSNNNYVNSNGQSEFLYSLTKQKKISIDTNFVYSTYNGSNYFPTFGGGHDLYLSSDCFNNNSSYTNLQHTYGTKMNFDDKRSFLAGNYNFKVRKIEVYIVREVIN